MNKNLGYISKNRNDLNENAIIFVQTKLFFFLFAFLFWKNKLKKKITQKLRCSSAMHVFPQSDSI